MKRFKHFLEFSPKKASLLILFLFLALTIGLHEGWKAITGGFSIENISSEKQIPHYLENEQSTEKLDSILGQTFCYLGRGSQSFVFESEDKQFVLKFFKHYRWKIPTWARIIPSKYRKRLIQRKSEALSDTFQSCVYAFHYLKDETAFIYPHLNKTEEITKSIHLIDRIGRHHRINPNEFNFVIQRKAISAQDKLLYLKKHERHDDAKRHLAKLFSIVLIRRERGFNDKDPHLLKNFGFIGNRAIELDLGGFFIDPAKDMQYFYDHELEKIRKKLIPWLKQNYPELTLYAESKIDSLQTRKQDLVFY